MSDSVSYKFEQNSESAPPISAAHVFSDIGNMNRYFQSQADVSTLLGNLDLTNNQFDDPGASRADRVTREVQNAQRQLPSLMDLSGASKDGALGLTMQHLEKLEKMRLTRDQQEAVAFLKENFGKLSTRRFGGTDITAWDPFKDYAITPSSIQRYGADADPIGRDRNSPRNGGHGKGDHASTPYDPANDRPERPDRRDVPPRRTGLRDGRDRSDEIIVKEGWGPWQVARESLKRQGIHTDIDGSVTRDEMRRLRELNPGMDRLHPNDRIRIR